MMVTTTSNDNDVNRKNALRGPDAHGQAALLLVESLIHSLVARSVINVADAIEIIGTAAEVKEEVADAAGDSPANLRKSLILLRAIGHSLDSSLVHGGED